MSQIPTVRLNNGVEMPVFGLGTSQQENRQSSDVSRAVKDAIDLGYRLLDCAHVDGNEESIGEAIQAKIAQGVVKREDLFVVGKLWCNSHRPDLVEIALTKTLNNLKLSYLDLYLIQWPQAFEEGTSLFPKHENTARFIYSDVDYVATWRSLEKMYRKDMIRAVGVSNFNSQQLERILNACTVFPQINQVECHPRLNQLKLRKFCEYNGITVMSYRPLGGFSLLKDERIKEIASRYNRTPAQILLRYNLQLGNVVASQSFSKGHISENLDTFNFDLAPEDMHYINTFDCNGRLEKFEETSDHIYYPFSVEF